MRILVVMLSFAVCSYLHFCCFTVAVLSVRLVLVLSSRALLVFCPENMQIYILYIMVLSFHVGNFAYNFYDFGSGNYCPIGSAAVIQCPAGTWGSTTGLQNATCSGQCTAGI